MTQVMMAMSGGVDSSVAAAMLVEQGHEVVGVTLKLWGGDSDSGCCSVSDVDDARWVADQLGIEHHVFNMGADFDTHVVDPYVENHAAGLTPNPCVECNRHVKFGKLHDRAKALGFDAVATGHHARLETLADGTFRLGRGADTAKDQSYVLYMLGQEQLGRLMLPLGGMTKDEVRAQAHNLTMRTADKPDSQDVCFITSVGGRQKFIGERLPLTPGIVVDTDGNQVGEVEAVELVTIGQRRGLGLAGGSDPRFVTDVNPTEARVTIGKPKDLLVESTPLGQLVWADQPVGSGADAGTAVMVQVSAHGTPAAATFHVDDQGLGHVRWAEPHRRVAPGQSVVLYDAETADLVQGGGIVVRDAEK